MTDASKPRWHRLTPDRVIVALLAVDGLLWLSGRFQWFSFNQQKGWTVLIAVAAVAVTFLLMLLWFIASLLFGWRFQFSLRSLLVLVIAVALPSSWLAVEMKLARVQKEAVVEIRQAGGHITYDWEKYTVSGGLLSFATRPKPALFQDFLGDDFFMTAVRAEIANNRGLLAIRKLVNIEQLDIVDSEVTDAGMEGLRELHRLRKLNLAGTWFGNPGGSNGAHQISDVGLECVEGLAQLRELNISGTKITDAGLKYLIKLLLLEKLGLGGTHVTDSGLIQLRGLTRLQALDLGCTHITDAGLACLKGLSHLQELNLSRTEVYDDGVKQLKDLDQLRDLYLVGTKVTEEGVEQLTNTQQLWNVHLHPMFGGGLYSRFLHLYGVD